MTNAVGGNRKTHFVAGRVGGWVVTQCDLEVFGGDGGCFFVGRSCEEATLQNFNAGLTKMRIVFPVLSREEGLAFPKVIGEHFFEALDHFWLLPGQIERLARIRIQIV